MSGLSSVSHMCCCWGDILPWLRLHPLLFDEIVALRKRQEDSERKAEDLTRQLQAMEAMMARGMGIPLGQMNIESPAPHSATAGQQAAAVSQAETLGTYIQDENEGPRAA